MENALATHHPHAQKMINRDFKVHHLWVVSRKGAPCGCISLTDMIQIIVEIATMHVVTNSGSSTPDVHGV
jgi:hypothetical protein